MAYSTSSPPQLRSQAIAGQREWVYSSTDVTTAVTADGYFTNGYDLGMRAGDLVIIRDSNGPVSSALVISASTASTGVVLGNGTSIGSTSNTA